MVYMIANDAKPNHCVERTGDSLHTRFHSQNRSPLPPVAHAGVRLNRDSKRHTWALVIFQTASHG